MTKPDEREVLPLGEEVFLNSGKALSRSNLPAHEKVAVKLKRQIK